MVEGKCTNKISMENTTYRLALRAVGGRNVYLEYRIKSLRATSKKSNVFTC